MTGSTLTSPASTRWRLRGHALAAVLAGWVLGTAAQLQQAQLWPAAAYAVLAASAALVAAMAWSARRQALAAPVALWLLAGALAAFAAVGWRADAQQSQALDPALEGRDLQVVGTVARMPQRSEAGWRFRFDVQAATLGGHAVRLPPALQLGWYATPFSARPDDAAPLAAELRAGDRWRLTVRLKAPHGNVNPHGFDYELWLWEQGVGATGYVRSGANDAPPERLAEGGWSVERWRQSVRDRILAGAAGGDAAQARNAGIVAALVTGDQAVIERADWDVFRITGVAHLMSISGLHITMFAWLAAGLVGRAWRQSARLRLPAHLDPCRHVAAPTAALVGGMLLAAGYALFSGWGVPAQRTVLMLATVAALRLAGLRWPWWLVLLLAAAVVLAFDPWALLQAGFWLSFVAVGVLFATDPGAARADGAPASGHFSAHLGRLLREQAVVTLALTPLSLLLFGQASVVGLLANLVAIPWVTLVVTPLALSGVLWAPLWRAAAWALAPLGGLLQWLTVWPWASVGAPAAPLLLGAAALVGGAMLAMRWPWPLRLAGLGLMAPMLLWAPARPAPGSFELLAADVGQGNAVLVRTASHSLLYDAGPRYSLESDAGQRVLVPLLRAGGERLDLLVLSHRDSDHTGGAPALLHAHPGAALLSSMEDAHALQVLRRAMRCQDGQQWSWDGVEFSMLHPLAADYASGANPNALSCVLRISAGGQVALLVGDIEAPQERALLERAAPLVADVLLAPHHGSRTSSSPAFVQAVRPRWLLVQAGYRNRFGHPVEEVLARYRGAGTQVADSSRCGAMHWSSANPDMVHCERQLGARYWRHRPGG